MDKLTELEVTVYRDFATKKEVSRLDTEVREIAKGHAILSTELKNIASLLEAISKNLQWGVRIVVGTLLTGAVIGAAYVIAQRSGLL